MLFGLSPRLLRYGVVGLLTYALYAGTGHLLLRAEVSLPVLAPIAFTVAIVFNYLLQRAWVFDDSRPVSGSLPKYLRMVLVGYVINSIVLLTLVPSLSLSLAQFVAVVLVIISNGLFSFLYVFSVKVRGNNE